MYRTEIIQLEAVGEDGSVAAAADLLRAAGLDQQQVDPTVLENHIEQWTASELWAVECRSRTYSKQIRSRKIDRVIESKGLNQASTEVEVNSWYNEMMEEVTCTKCGSTIPRLAVDSHTGSVPCRARKNRSIVREKGLARVATQSQSLQEHIEQYSDCGIEWYNTRYDPGSPTRRSKLRALQYAPKDAIVKARKQYLPAPRDRADRVGRILWRDTEYCIIVSDEETMDVIKVEDAERAARRRKLYVSSHSGDYVAYNSDGQRVGVPVTGAVGDVKTQSWNNDGAIVVIETGDGTDERTVELPCPVDFSVWKPSSPDEDESVTDATEENIEPNLVPKLTTAAIVPERNVIAAANGVIVQSGG
ncbi:hypothetical protein [Halosimplex pelagicum]|uniref:Uncharacterized protein n=1 Tax=Halosimplex pelagicum TaxID=869886 RepID=A0A7D5TBM0_9EURY|nr:hypothetical protein [Halosimplex pelagicum]QLH83830.1 hypothetical protein HZS54_20310 [Halosimplex pelagicum]